MRSKERERIRGKGDTVSKGTAEIQRECVFFMMKKE